MVLNEIYALTTFPLRRQEVQTRILRDPPFTRARTGRRFTFQRRLVTLCAWLMLLPDRGFLPQTSQTCAMTTPNPSRRGAPLLAIFEKSET